MLHAGFQRAATDLGSRLMHRRLPPSGHHGEAVNTSLISNFDQLPFPPHAVIRTDLDLEWSKWECHGWPARQELLPREGPDLQQKA